MQLCAGGTAFDSDCPVVGILLRAYSPHSSAGDLNDLRALDVRLPSPDDTPVVNELSHTLSEMLRNLASGDRSPPGEARRPDNPLQKRRPPFKYKASLCVSAKGLVLVQFGSHRCFIRC